MNVNAQKHTNRNQNGYKQISGICELGVQQTQHHQARSTSVRDTQKGFYWNTHPQEADTLSLSKQWKPFRVLCGKGRNNPRRRGIRQANRHRRMRFASARRRVRCLANKTSQNAQNPTPQPPLNLIILTNFS